MLQIKRFTLNPVSVNSYLLWDDESLRACLIDPGFSNEQEEQLLQKKNKKHGLTLERSICTHTHFDHTWGALYLEETFGIKSEAPERELTEMPSFTQQLRAFGMPVTTERDPDLQPLQIGSDGTIDLIGHTFHVLQTPGHSPGHVTLYSEPYKTLLVGDVLFANGYGRYDLWGSSYEALMDSLYHVLLPLPPETTVLPGHGPSTSIGQERSNLLYEHHLHPNK